MSAPQDSLQLEVEDTSTENGLQREYTRLNGLELSTLSNCSHQEETTPLSGRHQKDACKGKIKVYESKFLFEVIKGSIAYPGLESDYFVWYTWLT